LKSGAAHGLDLATSPEPPRAGLTSLPASAGTLDEYYRVTGFHLCGPRAVRIDMLERLADLIRVLVSWRADPANPALPPKGATGDGGFKATPDMMSILGCSAEELGNVLRALGFWADRRPIPVEPPASAAAVTGAAGETTAQTAEPLAEAAATDGGGAYRADRRGGERGG
jgi:ATP-dependent RNA helicase SUPV3L1/SUV3